YSDLGSGFHIAMKDLEIRGAGDLLGGEQSGFISSIGFEAYNNILNEAIKELKTNDFKELYEDQEEPLNVVDDCQIDTDFELLIPANYVQNISERLQLYHQLNACSNVEDLEQFQHELLDRFGPLPKPTKELIKSLPIKWMARDLGFQKLVMKSGKMIAYFISNPDSDYFKSEVFQHILTQVQHLSPQASIKQKNDKLSVVFQNVHSIDRSKQILTKLQLKTEVEA
ncbi:MAG: TRCF domain-containing protein, partial [Flavobacteriales bacterium]